MRTDLRPTAAALRRGRRLAVALSTLALIAAAVLWFGAGYRAANECVSWFPSADATEMTPDGFRVSVAGHWSDPMPTRDESLTLAALVFVALAAVPPYLLLFRRHD